MRVCLVGGIFGKPAEYRRFHSRTPETTLADGLRERGHEVVERGHDGAFDFGGFDVVHVHHLATGAVAAAAARRSVRLAFTPHWLRQDSAARRAAMRFVVARTGALVALSETEARWQRGEFGDVDSRQHVIPNGIDESVFRYVPPAPPAPGEPWRLLYVGQLVPFKGVDRLLQALARVAEPVALDLVYHVDTDEPQLRAEAERLGLERVRFLGARDPDELAALYASSHLLALPSVSGEALPSVVSEALFTGRPVVGTDVGAVAEQVDGFGKVVPPGDSGALAGAIGEVLAGYEALAGASSDASRDAVARYSVAAMVDAHERMYQGLLGGPAPERSVARRAADATARAGLALRPRAPGTGREEAHRGE
jgi:glycosyltransferase involved in cell wall biosynthesis